MAIITQTPRIIIREFLPEEENLFVELLLDTRINAYLPKRNEEQMRVLFADSLADYAAGIKLTRWAIIDVNDNAFMGFCLLKYVKEEPYKAELGYVLHLQYHNKGYATELSVALVKYGFEVAGLKEIFAVTVHENIPSQKVLLNAGLVQGDHIFRNELELSFFKITYDDWQSTHHNLTSL